MQSIQYFGQKKKADEKASKKANPPPSSSLAPASSAYAAPTGHKLVSYSEYSAGITKKKKRKKPSPLKKKIINERMVLHQARAPEFKDATGALIAESISDAERTVVLLNFTSGIEFSAENLESEDDSDLEKGFDPDELKETMDDARELLSRFGVIKHMYLAKFEDKKSAAGEFSSDETVENEGNPVVPDICVTFYSSSSVLLTLSALEGMVLGGQTITVRMLKQLLNPFTNEANVAEASVLPESLIACRNEFESAQFSVPGVKLVLENVLNKSDLEGVEEMDEVLADIRYLCESYGAVFSWKDVHMSIHLRSHPANHAPKTVSEDGESIEGPLTFLWVNSLSTAYNACLSTSGKMIGGRSITYTLYDYAAYENQMYNPAYCVPFPLPANHVPQSDEIFGVRLSGLSWLLDKSISADGIMNDLMQFWQNSFSEADLTFLKNIISGCEVYCGGFVQSVCDSRQSFAKLLITGMSFLESMSLQSTLCRSISSLTVDSTANAINNFSFLEVDGEGNDTKLNMIADVVVTKKKHRPAEPDGNRDTITANNEFVRLPRRCGDEAFDPSKVSDTAVSPRIVASKDGGCVVVVRGYVSEEDLVGDGTCQVFPEEIKALKIDFLNMLNLYKSPQSMCGNRNAYCKRLHFVSSAKLSSNSQRECCHDDSYAVAIQIKKLSDATDVMLSLDEIVLGGQPIRAMLSADRCTTENVVFSFMPGKQRVSVNDSTLLPPKISKLPLREAPLKTLPVASEEINQVVKTMLKKLSTFQQRARENDPINAKKKERFVMGIKQVTNTVKSGRSRLILLAPNTEESVTVDTKIENMIDEAQKAEIPILYSLKRRQLGKAVQSSMKQVVVGVTNPDGAYDEFKKILRFLDDM